METNDSPEQGELDKSTDVQSCRSKCIKSFITNLTFTLSFLSGLSLTLSGLFRTKLGNEELDGGKVQYKSKQVGLIGLIIVAYSIIGICLCCSRNLYQRYKVLCPINVTLSGGTVFYSLLGDPEGELMLMDIKSTDAN